MAIEVKVPKISEGVESAEVTDVLVSEGDTIEEEQSIITVETDKASADVPSSHGGTVKEVKVKAGDEVKIGDIILILEETGEGESEEEEPEEKEEEKKAGEKQEEAKEKEEPEKSPEKPEKKEGKKEKKEPQKEETDQERKSHEVPASPSIRRLARESGIDIRAVKGSGPGGRITEEDIKSHEKPTRESAAPKTLTLPDFSQWGHIEKQPLSRIRHATAKNLTSFWQSIPHVFQFDEADITAIEQHMEKISGKAEKAGGKLTITAVLTKIVANALQQFPKFNASIDMDNKEMILKNYISIGIAAATDKGLLVPVVRDVDHKNIITLAVEITKLAEKARDEKLAPEDMQGGNFTISNLGGIGGTNFTPVIYHPQVAILGVSRASTKPVFIDGNFEPRQILPLCLSYDHRLIDGAEGAAFLRWICQSLEDPYKAILGA